MNDYLNDAMILRQIIMDHYEYPRNHNLVEDNTYKRKHMNSESCIDDIEVQVKLNNNKIEDIRFDGEACTIATASTSIMSELLRDKSIEEANSIIENYYNMINEKDYDEDSLEEAIAFKTVGKQANRIKCATIGWDAIKELINER